MKAFIKQVHVTDTAQKMKFSIKDFFSKCDQIRIFLQIWSHLQKKSWIKIPFFVCSVFSFYIPWKNLKTRNFLMFSKIVEKDQQHGMGQWDILVHSRLRWITTFPLVYPFEWHSNVWHLIDPLECHANSHKPVETTKR